MNTQVYLVRPDGTGLRRLTDGGKETNRLGPWSPRRRRRWSLALEPAHRRRDRRLRRLDVAAATLRPRQPEPRHRRLRRPHARRRRALLNRARRPRRQRPLPRRRRDRARRPCSRRTRAAAEFDGAFAPDGRADLPRVERRTATCAAFARIRLAQTAPPARSTIVAERADAELVGFALDDAGTTAALLWNVAGKSELALRRPQDRRASTPAPSSRRRSPAALDFSHDGASLALVGVGRGDAAPTSGSSTSRPAPFRAGHAQPARRASTSRTLVRPELVRFKAHDGLELSGWLYRRAGRREARVPVVLSLPRRPRGPGAARLPQRLPGAPRAAASRCSRRTSAARPASARGSSTSTTARCASTASRTSRPASTAVVEVRRRRPEARRHHGRLVRRLHGDGRPDRVPGPLRRRRRPLRRRQLRDLLQAHRAVDGRDLQGRVRRPRSRRPTCCAASRPSTRSTASPRRPSSSTAPTTPTCRWSKPSRSSTA